MIDDLDTALGMAAEDPAVRTVVITGAGRAFCAGADLMFAESLADQPHRIATEFLAPFSAFLDKLGAVPKPVIAVVNGVCVGGGLELVLCCDLILAAEDARIADGHAKFGLLPTSGAAQRLARAIGTFKAKEMLFTAAFYSAAQLESAGLVNFTVPAAQLDAEAMRLVAELAARSPAGLSRMKELVRDEADMTPDAAARYELRAAENHFHTGIPREGIAAFTEGRKPNF
ncbi:enoyl-CoA hydratase/isomerase family protein (plasmid) [Rhodococcus ruber]|uniref:enoyl-CoA hydratase/isomerase family protein n=1 Tax=Rhodococcus ruber TaxID=1830 RepID=UPI00265A88D6|nr:enoyl-CoA hydratase/isomerase family protein [Rhodococcus ruber]WKK14872.1 enoyl-CoA hydratase/isomerase family protein [Rhodococcus ruber]